MTFGQRHGVCTRDGHDARKCGHALAEFVQQLHGSFRGIAVQARIDGHHQNAARAESDLDARSVPQAAQEQAGGAKQHQRHGDLRDHQDIAQVPDAARAAQHVLAFQRACNHGTCRRPRRGQSEEESRTGAQREGVEQDSPIHANREIERNWRGDAECSQPVRGPKRKSDAEYSAAQSQEHAFGEHLAQQVAACGPQGQPHGHLPLAAGSLRQR